jgi:acyl carrier protein
MTATLEFTAFCERVADELDLPPSRLRPEANLVADLNFDSLLTYELVLLVEELAEATLPEHLISQLLTIDDVYSVYRTRATQR